MANTDFTIALRNYAGVPVVELVGDLNKTTLNKLNDVLKRLASAGHYNVMVNLKRAVLENLSALASLNKVAQMFQAHYGGLDVILEAKQISALMDGKKRNFLVRFCTSEGQALARIRRLPAASAHDVTPMQAHLAES